MHSTTHTHTELKMGYETVPLTVTVNDDCGASNTQVSIQVFSDEVPLSAVKYQPSAALGRAYGSLAEGAALTGWTLTLSRAFAKSQSNINKDWATVDYADGRYYTVRVCAQDLAGNVGCDEAAIAVPAKSSGSSKALATPVNSGKAYSVSTLHQWAVKPPLPYATRARSSRRLSPIPPTRPNPKPQVASDLVYWGQAQTDIPFRLQNTGLTGSNV